MPAALDDEGGVYKEDGKPAAYAEPKIVILAGGQGFVEQADLLKQLFTDHYGRRTHQAKMKGWFEDHSRPFSMSLLRVDPNPVSNPYLLGLTDHSIQPAFEKLRLPVKLVGQPLVIGIEKGDE